MVTHEESFTHHPYAYLFMAVRMTVMDSLSESMKSSAFPVPGYLTLVPPPFGSNCVSFHGMSRVQFQ